MKRTYRIAWIVFGLLLGSRGFAAPDAELFQLAFESGLATRPVKGIVLRPKAHPADFEYVLVGGIVSDYLRRVGYFSVFAQELELQGVPAAQVHAFFPPSSRSVADNAKNFLVPRVRAAVANSDRPIVFVAHSKGAVETMQMLLDHADLLDRTDSFWSVQGAFGGSPIANLLTAGMQPAEKQQGVVNRAGLVLLKTLNGFFHRSIRGVEDLTIEKSQVRLQDWYDHRANDLLRVAKKTLFLRTKSQIKTMDLRTRVGASFLLSAGILENDGALAVENQFVPGLPAPSVMVDGVDHGLPCGDLLAHRNHFKAVAFVRAMLVAIGY